MRRHAVAPLAAAFAFALCLMFAPRPVQARLLVEIDKSSQLLTVSRDGALLHRWPVSTGLRAHDTPSGSYTPFRMEKDHFSREWDDAPMPHSIFFTKKGHAIHGTTHLRAIGRPASHGCVRLEPQNARVLFDLVRREGMANTQVVLHGVTPPAGAPQVARTAPYPERPPAFGPSDFERREPGYVAPGDRAARSERTEPATGYWVQYPDGRRIFVDREYNPPPAPFPQWRGLPGWN
jgi:hypothetical protein